MPHISIIVPVYNVAAYLDECVKSLLDQTLSDIEIILVDDGSTDKSGEMIDSYARADSRVIALHKKNGGQSSARNLGLSVASGKYILFVDSDDYIIKETCQTFFETAERLDADIVAADCLNDYDRIYSSPDFRNFPKENEVVSGCTFIREKIKSGTYDIVPWLYFVKADYLKRRNISFSEGHFYEDQLYTLMLLADNSSKVTKIRFPFYFYRMDRPDSTTNYMTLKKGLDAVFICNTMREYAQKELKNTDKQIIMTVLLISYYHCMSVWLRLRRSDRKQVWMSLNRCGLTRDLSCVCHYKHLKRRVFLFLRCRFLLLCRQKIKHILKK